MKILIINRYFCELSAVETLSWKTYQYLKEQGHDVFFFATDKRPFYIEHYEYSKYFSKDRYSTIEYIKNPISYYWDFEAYNKLKLMLKEIQPDVVHINQPITISIIKVIKEFNIPIVWTLHDPNIACPASTLKMGNGKICNNYYCKNQKYYHCIKYKCQSNKLEPTIRKTIRSYFNFYTNLYKSVDLYVTPSFALKKLVLEANLGIKEENISVINNFISYNPNVKLQKKIDKNSYFLFVGRIVEEKGIQFLLEAIKGLPKEIKFKIAGTGNMDTYVRKYIIQHNLDNVDFVGYVKQDEINPLYEGAIATIVPSNFFEIFGMINIESFINKTPVIGSNIAAIPEIVDDNQNGFIFNVGDVETLKKQILVYWNDFELAKKHGENGFLKTIKNYTEERYMNLLINEYNRLTKVTANEN